MFHFHLPTASLSYIPGLPGSHMGKVTITAIQCKKENNSNRARFLHEQLV